MKQKFENEPLDFEYKPVKRSFQLVFSIEGILILVLIVCMYMAYYQSITARGGLGLGGQVIFIFIHFLLIFWQFIGDFVALRIDYDTNFLKKTHLKGLFVAFLLNVLVLLLNYGENEDYGFLWNYSLLLIPHILAWAYAIVCFVRQTSTAKLND
jgi:hypothetical protein